MGRTAEEEGKPCESFVSNSLFYLIRFCFQLEGGEEISNGHSEEESGGCGSGGSGGNQTGGCQGGSKAAGAIANAGQIISTVEDGEGGNNGAGGLSDCFFINTYINNQK